MNLSHTEKLILENISTKNFRRVVEFESYLKRGFVGRALTLTINPGDIIEKIYFSSNDHGTALWINGQGITDAHRWEGEEDLIDLPSLARYYSTLLENGPVPANFVFDMIIPDVLDNMLDNKLSSIIHDIIKNTSSDQSYNWNKIIKKYKSQSTHFIKKLQKRMQ
ncbi:MAG: hypothetical protein GY754_03715 [bacterium]|nr:hypothetical protein [bacterium]